VLRARERRTRGPGHGVARGESVVHRLCAQKPSRLAGGSSDGSRIQVGSVWLRGQSRRPVVMAAPLVLPVGRVRRASGVDELDARTSRPHSHRPVRSSSATANAQAGSLLTPPPGITEMSPRANASSRKSATHSHTRRSHPGRGGSRTTPTTTAAGPAGPFPGPPQRLQNAPSASCGQCRAHARGNTAKTLGHRPPSTKAEEPATRPLPRRSGCATLVSRTRQMQAFPSTGELPACGATWSSGTV